MKPKIMNKDITDNLTGTYPARAEPLRPRVQDRRPAFLRAAAPNRPADLPAAKSNTDESRVEHASNHRLQPVT